MHQEIIYSAQKRGFLPGRRYANPRYFVAPARDVTSVIIVGEFANIAEAYQYSDPSISVVQVPDPQSLDLYLEKGAARRGKLVEGPSGTASLGTPGLPPAAVALTATSQLARPEPARESARQLPEPQADVDIPGDWRDMVWPRLKSLAAKLTDEPIRNRDEADRAIEQCLKRRAAGEKKP